MAFALLIGLVVVSLALRRRHAKARPPPVAGEKTAPSTEAAEVLGFRTEITEATAMEPRALPLPWSVPRPAYLIEYSDADGRYSRRVIRVRHVRQKADVIYIVAYCYLVGAERTFRADRILTMRDYHTGDSVSDLAAPLSLPSMCDDQG